MAKQMTADEESILKRQARRRLIGAIALTTAVVVILPIVFDGEPPSTTMNDIELRIPDKDKIGDFQSGVPASSVSASAVSAASSVRPVSVSPSAVSSVVLPAVSAVIAASPVVSPVIPPHLQERKVEHPKTGAPKPIQLEPKVDAKSAATHYSVPRTGFVVQVGAFANADTAKKLQEKLAAQGFHAYDEKIGSSVRVRVGGFPTHEAADKVRHKLEQQGLHPNVVSLGG
jgi:DedD protein